MTRVEPKASNKVEPKASSKNGWQPAGPFLETSAAARVPPSLRILLTSDGTLTTHLAAWLRTPIRLRILRQQHGPAPIEIASALEVSPDEKGIEREVVLSADGWPVVYARSFFPLGFVEPEVRHRLFEQGESLGDVLRRRRLPSARERLEVGRIRDARVAEALGDSGSVWARRSCILLDPHLRAHILEAFSPRLWNGGRAKGEQSGRAKGER